MGLIVRSEPVGAKYMAGYPQLKEMLQKYGWLNFMINLMVFIRRLQNPLLDILMA